MTEAHDITRNEHLYKQQIKESAIGDIVPQFSSDMWRHAIQLHFPKSNIRIKGLMQPGNKQFARPGLHQVQHKPDKIEACPEGSPFDPSKYYSLVMCDPDAPSRNSPKYRSWLHYTVINIRPSETGDVLDLNKGEEVVTWAPPSPPPGTGFHRYIWFLFESDNNLQFHGTRITGSSGKGRASFNIQDFIKSHHLGQPVSVAAFEVHHE